MNLKQMLDFDACLKDILFNIDQLPLAATIGDDLYIKSVLYNIASSSRIARLILVGVIK